MSSKDDAFPSHFKQNHCIFFLIHSWKNHFVAAKSLSVLDWGFLMQVLRGFSLSFLFFYLCQIPEGRG